MALTVNNISISNIIGGTGVFNTINRVGIAFATGNVDQGTFTIGSGTPIAWDDLDDGDAFDETLNLDGGNDGDDQEYRETCSVSVASGEPVEHSY